MEEVERMIKAGIISIQSCGAVDVKGQKKGAKMRYILYSTFMDIKEVEKRMPGANPVAYVTSVPASIYTKMILAGRIKTRGVVPPEALEPGVRQEYMTELAEKGIRVHEKMEKLG